MNEDIGEKLDILIKLQATALVNNFESSKEKILFLSKSGLKPTLIADLLGTSANYVNVTLSRERKSKKLEKKSS